MSIFKKIGDIFGGPVIESIGNVADKFITTKQEKEEFKAELLKVKQQFEMDIYALEVEDRKSAREMYKEDSGLQKVFSIVFLAGYIGMTVFLFGWVVRQSYEPWAISLISAIWGGVSAKINTIVDFLFGSSAGSKTKDEKLNLPK